MGVENSHIAAFAIYILFILFGFGFLRIIFIYRSTEQLFFALTYFFLFASTKSSGMSGMEPKDLLAVTELKL